MGMIRLYPRQGEYLLALALKAQQDAPTLTDLRDSFQQAVERASDDTVRGHLQRVEVHLDDMNDPYYLEDQVMDDVSGSLPQQIIAALLAQVAPLQTFDADGEPVAQNGTDCDDADQRLIDTLIEILNLPWARSVLSGAQLDDLRKVLLRPDEMDEFLEHLKAHPASCGGCGHTFAEREMATFMHSREAGRGSWMCTTCYLPQLSACPTCGSRDGRQSINLTSLQRLLKNPLSKCTRCAREAQEVEEATRQAQPTLQENVAIAGGDMPPVPDLAFDQPAQAPAFTLGTTGAWSRNIVATTTPPITTGDLQAQLRMINMTLEEQNTTQRATRRRRGQAE